jgi:hypothetical protein
MSQSGKVGLFSPPPHTTQHAGPHRAVRFDGLGFDGFGVGPS